jgi:hypothetical protein
MSSQRDKPAGQISAGREATDIGRALSVLEREVEKMGGFLGRRIKISSPDACSLLSVKAEFIFPADLLREYLSRSDRQGSGKA